MPLPLPFPVLPPRTTAAAALLLPLLRPSVASWCRRCRSEARCWPLSCVSLASFGRLSSCCRRCPCPCRRASRALTAGLSALPLVLSAAAVLATACRCRLLVPGH